MPYYLKLSKKTLIKSLLTCALLGAACVNVSALVYHVSQKAEAADTNTGTADKPFRTINHAAQIAIAGDTVIIHEGKYREWVSPQNSGTANGPIEYMAAADERVVISGSEELNLKWMPLFPEDKKLGVVKADIPENIFPANPRLPGKNFNPFKIPLRASSYRTPEERFAEPEWDKDGGGHLVIGEVYAGGIPLKQVRTVFEVVNTRGTYCVTGKGKTIVINFFKYSGPGIEVSVRPYAFAPKLRGLGYIKVKGFIFEHATNAGTYPGTGMVSTRTGHHWTIENNIIRYCGMIGLDIGSEVIAHGAWLRKAENKDKSIDEGLWAPGVKPPDYEISWNRQEEILKSLPKNKVYEFMRARDYPSADAPSRGHIVRNNLVHDCGLTGIFLPKCDDSLIENNVVERCNRRFISIDRNHEIEWNECAGFKALSSRNLIVKSNIIRDNHDKGSGIWFDFNCWGNIIDGNIVVNNYYGIYLEACAGTKILKNIVSNNISIFNRIDGFNSSDSTNPAIIANNLFAYNGRWGCAVIVTDRWDRDNSPVAFTVANNVFIGNEQGAFRIPLSPLSKASGNNFSGNVFQDNATFQTSMGTRNKLAPDDMINEMKGFLTKANVDKNDWPDFSTWSVQNKWYRGYCKYKAFIAAISGDGNIETAGLQVNMYELINRFRYDDAEGHPVGEHLMLELKQGYIMIPAGWAGFNVKPVPEIKTDFFGNKLNSEKVIPGPFQEIKNNSPIKISINTDHHEQKK